MNAVIRGGATVLFVSHNLRTVADFCDRCLLLEKGNTIMTGPTHEVISSYLTRSQNSHLTDTSLNPARITAVTVRNEKGECGRFQSGEKAWVDIEVRARTRCSRMSISLYITDDQFQSVFDTSTERLGHGNFDLEEGDVYRCTFELHLNMAVGIFSPSVLVYRYDTQTEYDRWAPATSIYVSSAVDVRGSVNCFPTLTRQEIRRASDVSLAAIAADSNRDHRWNQCY